MSNSICPDFVNVGPGRCASSWLLEVLESHPEIGMARIKETEFFNTNFDKGTDWYQSLFPKIKAGVTGEISNCYYTEPLVPPRLFDYRPDVKLIINVRNPYSLLKSFHGFGVRRGLPLSRLENDLDVPIGKIMGSGYDQRAKKQQLNQGDTVTLLDSVLLSQHFERFLDTFPSEQIYFFVFERLKSDSDAVIRELYQFLGVDDQFVPSMADEVVNEAIVPKSKMLARLAASTAFTLRQLGAYGLLDQLKKSRLLKRVLFSRAVNTSQQPQDPQSQLPPAVRARIDQEIKQMISLHPVLATSWNHLLESR